MDADEAREVQEVEFSESFFDFVVLEKVSLSDEVDISKVNIAVLDVVLGALSKLVDDIVFDVLINISNIHVLQGKVLPHLLLIRYLRKLLVNQRINKLQSQ